MPSPTEAYRRENLDQAWGWIKSNPDAGYKSYCGAAYSRYALADTTLLDQLKDELDRGIFKPTHATKIFLPKRSGILRPYTVLTGEDQIVYQAMVNVIADRLGPKMRRHYLRASFGHMFSGRSSKWFYKPWRQGYSAFNKASRDAFRRGLKFTASFDLTACYDSLDYEVLGHFLQKLGCHDDFCRKLKEYLGFWTATSTRIYHSHGIPQGPLSSGLLSEVVLRHFDLNYGAKSNVRYLRYVDDIRLFATNEDALRRMLVRLDMLSKDIGLFPQAGKINIHEIKNIEEELKSVSGIYHIDFDSDEDDDEKISQYQIRKKLIELSPRYEVENNTRFKFLLSRADPSSKLNGRLLRISLRRTDLLQSVMRHFRKYDRLPTTVARDLLDRLSSEPLYENTTAEIVITLDQRTPRTFRRRAEQVMKRLWQHRSLGPELRAAVGKGLFRNHLISEKNIQYALLLRRDWWVRAELYSVLNTNSFGAIFLGNALNRGTRDAIGDVSLSAATGLAKLGLKVVRPLKGLNLAAARALRQLGIISRLPHGVDGVERSMSQIVGRPTRVIWRNVFGKVYKQAEKQAVFCRALADTDMTSFINATDVFNDLLLDRLYRHDTTLGRYTLGNIGSILSSVRFQDKYPAVFALVNEIHEKRLVSNLSHAVARRTGKPTGRIKYQYRIRATRLMRAAFAELATNW